MFSLNIDIDVVIVIIIDRLDARKESTTDTFSPSRGQTPHVLRDEKRYRKKFWSFQESSQLLIGTMTFCRTRRAR